jgi:hypothetical protein
MNRKELIETIRTDTNEIEALMAKLKFRCDHLKWLADEIEFDGARPPAEKVWPPPKIRKIVDKIYGETKKK